MHEYGLAPESKSLNFNQRINKAEQYYKQAGNHPDALTDRAYFYENNLVKTENPFVDSLGLLYQAQD